VRFSKIFATNHGFWTEDGDFVLTNGVYQSTNGNCQSNNEVFHWTVATFIHCPANFMGMYGGIWGDSVEMRLGFGG
jgi:hypothetical protein